MKESELIIMKNKIEALSRVSQMMLEELHNMRTLSVGTFQTIKEMPQYEEAVKKLTERSIEEAKTEDKTGEKTLEI